MAEASRIFGVSLGDVVKRSPTKSLPPFITGLIDHLRAHALSTENLFRTTPATRDVVKEIKAKVDQGEEVQPFSLDLPVSGSLLKSYLKELPEPLLTFELYSDFISSINFVQCPSYVEFIASLIAALPPANKELFEKLIRFFNLLKDNASQNKMPASNLGMVFGPLLMRPANETIEIPMNAIKSATLLKFIIENCEAIFKPRTFPDVNAKNQLLAENIPPLKLPALQDVTDDAEKLRRLKEITEEAILIVQEKLDLLLHQVDSISTFEGTIDIARRVRAAKRTLFSEENGQSPQPLIGYKIPRHLSVRTNRSLVVKSGVESLQGKRKTMEDTHLCIDDVADMFPRLPKNVSRGYYAVYDGHAGIETATLAEEHLHKNIFMQPAFAQGDITKAIYDGLHETDQFILKTANASGFNDGSTVVLCIITDNPPHLYGANLGDSEAILGKRRPDRTVEPIVLSQIHKPTEPAEKQRIEAEGGQVYGGRVFGSLAVSRALGDREFKIPVSKADFVSGEPYVFEMELQPEDEFLVVACDGLWDKVTYKDAITFIANCLEAGNDPKQTSCLLAREAIDRGSTDNVSVIVVSFKWT